MQSLRFMTCLFVVVALSGCQRSATIEQIEGVIDRKVQAPLKKIEEEAKKTNQEVAALKQDVAKLKEKSDSPVVIKTDPSKLSSKETLVSVLTEIVSAGKAELEVAKAAATKKRMDERIKGVADRVIGDIDKMIKDDDPAVLGPVPKKETSRPPAEKPKEPDLFTQIKNLEKEKERLRIKITTTSKTLYYDHYAYDAYRRNKVSEVPSGKVYGQVIAGIEEGQISLLNLNNRLFEVQVELQTLYYRVEAFRRKSNNTPSLRLSVSTFK